MEYYRTEDGQIQASLALRLGKILYQYRHLLTTHEKYEVSLSIIILQNILTNCVELFNSMTSNEKKSNPLHKPLSEEDPWKLSPCIKENSFGGKTVSSETVLRHLRNSLSHPTRIIMNASLVSTGYTTDDKSKSIERVIFVTSPDVKITKSGHTVLKDYPDIDAAKKILKNNNFPADVSIGQSPDNKFIFYRNGAPFHRKFHIELTPDQIYNITIELCGFLSHPLNQDWDGVTFNLKTIAA